MDRLTRLAAFAAVLSAFVLSACGGGGGGSSAAQSSGGGTQTVQTVEGVSTPSSVSVVTAKNAD